MLLLGKALDMNHRRRMEDFGGEREIGLMALEASRPAPEGRVRSTLNRQEEGTQKVKAFAFCHCKIWKRLSYCNHERKGKIKARVTYLGKFGKAYHRVLVVYFLNCVERSGCGVCAHNH